MKTSACWTALILSSLLPLWADESVGKSIQPVPAPMTTGHGSTATAAKPPVPAANLRDNPAYNIPFPQPASGFQDNPDSRPIKIGPMPDALNPFGPKPPLVKITTAPANEKEMNGSTIDLPTRNVVEIPQASVKTASAGTSQETVTLSPFLDWIQNTKNAAEVARQQRQAIEQNDLRDKTPQDGTDQDLFVHIRFPYVGNQDLPPSGGSVTYSIPQR